MYIGASAVVCFLLFSVLQIWLWFIISAIVMGIALSFALAKVNGRPMSAFAVAAFNYFWQAKILVFQAPVTVPTGLRNIQPATVPGKKLEVPVKPLIPEEIITIPSPVIPKEVISVTAPKPAPATPKFTPEISVPTPVAEPVTVKKTPLTVPVIPEMPVVKAPLTAVKRPESLLQGLFNRITVSSSPIPQRELSLKKESTNAKQRYAVIQKASGETDVVRRVDYR